MMQDSIMVDTIEYSTVIIVYMFPRPGTPVVSRAGGI